MKHINLKVTGLLALLISLGAASNGHAQLLLSLQSANYNATTGIWSDTSGNGDDATAGGNLPTLAANATPNGSAAVDFTGTLQSLQLETAISAQDVTIFAYILPSVTQSGSGGDRGAIISGGGGGFEYGITSFAKYGNSEQDALRTSQKDLGASTSSVSTSAFSLVDVSESLTTGGTYRLNGVDDGSLLASASGAPFLTTIGSQDTGSEFFSGDIAAIEVYAGTMTDAQRAVVEASLIATYSTAPEPSTWALLLGGLGLLALLRRVRMARQV